MNGWSQPFTKQKEVPAQLWDPTGKYAFPEVDSSAELVQESDVRD